jgi:O-antigen/teichoic acid export membrane protein
MNVVKEDMSVVEELISPGRSEANPADVIPKQEKDPAGGHRRTGPVRNILFSGARLVIGATSSVCVSAIMARTLGPQNLGVYSYAIWIVGTLGILANVGLPHALTKYVSEFMGSGDTATAVRICKRLLRTQLIAAVSVAALTASFWFLKTPYRSIIVLSAVMILLQALQQGLIAALAGVQRFDKIAWISLYAALAQVASVSAAALLHAGVMGMLWATLAGLGMGTWLSYRAVDRLLLKLSAPSPLTAPHTSSFSASNKRDIYLRIRRFSMTISYLLVLDSIVWQRSEVLFLKWYSTLPQIAFYTLAFAIASKMTEVSSTFSSTLLPYYSESYGRNGLREVGLVYVKALKYLQMVMVFPCLLTAAICGPLVKLVYGANYELVVLPLQLLLISLAITSIGVVGAPLLLGTEKQSFMAKYGTFVAILNIFLDFVLIPKHGALGAAGANCTAQIVGVLGAAFYVLRYAQAKFPWKATATIYFASAVSVAPVIYAFSGAQAGIVIRAGSIAVSGLLYLGLLVFAGELGKHDLGALKEAVLTKVYSTKLAEAGSTV